jgi:hypothetical protein
VPDTDNGMSAIEIEIFLTLVIPYFTTFALHDVHIEERIYIE